MNYIFKIINYACILYKRGYYYSMYKVLILRLFIGIFYMIFELHDIASASRMDKNQLNLTIRFCVFYNIKARHYIKCWLRV